MRSLDPLMWGSQGPQPMLLGVTATQYAFSLLHLRICGIFAIMILSGKKFFLMSQTFTCTFMTCTWPQAALCLLPTFAQMLLWLPKRGP